MTHDQTTDRRPIPYLAPKPAPSLARAILPLVLLLAGAAAAAQPVSGSSYGPGSVDPGAPDPQGFDGSYSYVRVLEGSATLIQGDTGDRDQLQVNQPVLAGDRIWVAPRGRVEVVLSDRNLLRIDAGSEVGFEALAGSPDRDDPVTILRLAQGNVQLVVPSEFLGEGLPRIDTPNATVYAYDLGTFRITADADDWTEVVAREGSAEVITPSGSLVLRQEEEAIVEGTRRPVSRVRRAGRLDSLELWGARLDREARYADVPYVDDSLRYEAATLDRYGSWVSIEGRYAWRPRVASDWRPYWNGRWSHSPLGYTWVSYEPWGWVPYHYGTWDYVPGYGWAWFPGYHFAPAWVYWYWTDAYVGWVPVGYYTHFYHPLFDAGIGFRSGHYGWVGGRWSHYRHWNFCDLRYFGHGVQHHHVHRGDRFSDHSGHAVPRRGILTTDTRAIPRDALDRPSQIQEILAARTRAERNTLPDATSFVAREREIGSELRERILVDRRKEAGRRTPTLLVDAVDEARGSRAGSGQGALRRGERKTPSGFDLDRLDRGDGAARREDVRSLRRNVPEVRPDARANAPDRTRVVKPRGTDGGTRVDPGDRGDRTGSVERALPGRRTPETDLRKPRGGDSRGSDASKPGSWRDRAPVKPRVVPQRPPERPSTRRPPSDGVRDRIDRVDSRRSSDARDGRSSVSRRVIERVRDLREKDRSVDRRSKPSTTRSRSSSPPPKTRSSASRDRSGGRSSVSSRSGSRSRGSSVSSRSSSSRTRSSSGSRSRSSSSRSSGKSRSRGKPPG